MNRRDFLKMSSTLALSMGLSSAAIPKMAEALEELVDIAPPVLWLQGQSCSGCSVSFLNAAAPGPALILTDFISLRFHSTLSCATGAVAMNALHRTIEEGGFFLLFEGAVPDGMPRACVMEEPMANILEKAAQKAKAVIAVGTCAAFGGIPAAENNPTNACSAIDFLKKKNIATPALRIPGCPAHPDWLVGTIAAILKFGIPEIDAMGRPNAYYAKLIHDQCPRFADYERERFAKKFGDDGCLFHLGCLGPITHADCTVRYWNNGVNTCIRAGAPCIGCASESFAAKASLPFYPKGLHEKEKEA